MKQQSKTAQKGYTLVEIAMVLAILGIVVGGILQGRAFIENAKIKSVIDDFDNMTQAYYGYIKRTGVAPGLPRDAGGNVTSDAFDVDLFFEDLIAEGFLLNSPAEAVKHAYHGAWTVRSQGAPQLCAEALSLVAARAVDQKLDDDVPNTGQVTTKYNSSYLIDYATGSTLTTEDVFVVCKRL